MPFDYQKNPQAIEKESFRLIREQTALEQFSSEQQQVVMRIVHCTGMPEIVEHIRFSSKACVNGISALNIQAPILCDVEMVKQGVTKRFITDEPLCFLNDKTTAARAKTEGISRTMAALEHWKEHLAGSVVLIGNAPTALFRLLEMLESGSSKPALIIAMPVGFVGAAESKQALWDHQQQLGIECITFLGKQGGSAVTAASCNALLRCVQGKFY